MSLMRNGIDLSSRLKRFIATSTDLAIFVPYIKIEQLKLLLAESNKCKTLVVRWEPKDLIFGSSDLEVYEYCKSNGIALYRNSRLHLKVFIDDSTKCILGSANISARALNLPESKNHNYELAIEYDHLTLDDQLYFHVLLMESTLITDEIFVGLRDFVTSKKIEEPNEMEFSFGVHNNNFLRSALPMSFDVETLLRVCETRETQNTTELKCALHDLALYDLRFGSKSDISLDLLRASFFSHPFIKAFLSNLERDGFIYFGAAKEWIHNMCRDVPLPRRWEITENIQILFRWIVSLGSGTYEVDIPGARSERLRIIPGKSST